jgi:carboxypeptidase family protein
VLEEGMTSHAATRRLAAALIAFVVTVPVLAQVTTGIVTGSVRDEQGSVIPGATVALMSSARGTRVAETVTNANGDFVFPNVTADTYVVEVTLQGFRPARREGIYVSAGDRVAVPVLTLGVGAVTETVVVTGEVPLVQAVSGERSFTVPTESVQNLPLANRNFAQVALLVPGVGGPVGGANVISAAGGVSRLGGGGQNNIMMDGLSTMDTGNNGQNIQMNT